MKLTKEDILVLKACNEEPGSAKLIASYTSLPEKKVKQILNSLEKSGLVYFESDIGMWSTTLKGMKKLRSSNAVKNKKILTKQEYKALYMCDDGLGLTELIANKLSITEKQANQIMDRLVNLGFVTKTESVVKNGRILKMGEKTESYWYEITSLGENYMSKWGSSYNISIKD